MRDSVEEKENQKRLLVWEGERSQWGSIVDDLVAEAWLQGGDSTTVGLKRSPGSLSPMRQWSRGDIMAICMGTDYPCGPSMTPILLLNIHSCFSRAAALCPWV